MSGSACTATMASGWPNNEDGINTNTFNVANTSGSCVSSFPDMPVDDFEPEGIDIEIQNSDPTDRYYRACDYGSSSVQIHVSDQNLPTESYTRNTTGTYTRNTTGTL